MNFKDYVTQSLDNEINKIRILWIQSRPQKFFSWNVHESERNILINMFHLTVVYLKTKKLFAQGRDSREVCRSRLQLHKRKENQYSLVEKEITFCIIMKKYCFCKYLAIALARSNGEDRMLPTCTGSHTLQWKSGLTLKFAYYPPSLCKYYSPDSCIRARWVKKKKTTTKNRSQTDCKRFN